MVEATLQTPGIRQPNGRHTRTLQFLFRAAERRRGRVEHASLAHPNSPCLSAAVVTRNTTTVLIRRTSRPSSAMSRRMTVPLWLATAGEIIGPDGVNSSAPLATSPDGAECPLPICHSKRKFTDDARLQT